MNVSLLSCFVLFYPQKTLLDCHQSKWEASAWTLRWAFYNFRPYAQRSRSLNLELENWNLSSFSLQKLVQVRCSDWELFYSKWRGLGNRITSNFHLTLLVISLKLGIHVYDHQLNLYARKHKSFWDIAMIMPPVFVFKLGFKFW